MQRTCPAWRALTMRSCAICGGGARTQEQHRSACRQVSVVPTRASIDAAHGWLWLSQLECLMSSEEPGLVSNEVHDGLEITTQRCMCRLSAL